MSVSCGITQKTLDPIKSKSLKAKYIAKRPEIDESLFGTPTPIQASAPTCLKETKKNSRKSPRWSNKKITTTAS
jgi:hypothetical protein